MPENHWVELWPGWARHWYRMVLRILLGATGTMLGIGLIVLADFGASFKETNPNGTGRLSRS